jgi:hypothetical protein
VATGLDNPRGMSWAADGSLLVAEAGRGGTGSCVPGVFSPTMCLGPSGAVTQIKKKGQQRRIVVGLPSLAPATGGFAFGPSDVSADGGRVYVSVGGPVIPSWRGEQLSEPIASELGTIQQITGTARHTTADIAAFTAANDPDGPPLESNTQSVLANRHTLLAVDAAGNTVLAVSTTGEATPLQVFEDREQGGVHYEAVPTNLAAGPDGAVYLSDLTGAPFPEGASIIWRWDGHAFVPYAEGFTTAIDLAFGPDGSLYVVENRSIIGLSGRVVRQAPNGTRTVVIDNLNFPTGIAVGNDGAVYVSNCGVCAGGGEVRRFAI